MDGEGMVALPLEHPGIGVLVDAARIDDLTRRQEVLASQ